MENGFKVEKGKKKAMTAERRQALKTSKRS